jgi:hypothetical protein
MSLMFCLLWLLIVSVFIKLSTTFNFPDTPPVFGLGVIVTIHNQTDGNILAPSSALPGLPVSPVPRLAFNKAPTGGEDSFFAKKKGASPRETSPACNASSTCRQLPKR